MLFRSQYSRKGAQPDGKNIVSSQNWKDSLKSSTLMSPFPTILEFLVFCCLCVYVWGLDIYVLACEILIRMRLLYALYMQMHHKTIYEIYGFLLPFVEFSLII